MTDNDAKLKLIVEMEQDPDNAERFEDGIKTSVLDAVRAGLDEAFKDPIAIQAVIQAATPGGAAEGAAADDPDRIGKTDLEPIIDILNRMNDDNLELISTDLESIYTDVGDILSKLEEAGTPGGKTDLEPIIDILNRMNDDNLELISTDLESIYTDVGDISEKMDAMILAIGDIGSGASMGDDDLGNEVEETRGIVQRILDWLNDHGRKRNREESGESESRRDAAGGNDSGGFPIIIPDLFSVIGDWIDRHFGGGRKKEGGSSEDTGSGGSGDDDKDDDAKFSEKWSPIIMKGVSLGTQGLKMVADTSLGFVSSIYRYMKQSSPLLQSVESLFNLAMTLFFLPLGTKLAEEILPATLDMIDAVVDMWDAFDGMTLSEMADYMVSEGAKIFSQYLQDIGESLSEQEGLIGSIGNLLMDIGDFIENHGEQLVNLLVKVADLIISNFKEFISLYVALQTAQLGAMMLSGIPGGALIGGLLGGAIGGLGTYAALSAAGMADGGYVPATEGGQVRLLAEGGEGEYVVPESKAEAFADSVNGRGGNTYNINIQGYTDSELRHFVTDIVNEQVAFSRLKGSF